MAKAKYAYPKRINLMVKIREIIGARFSFMSGQVEEKIAQDISSYVHNNYRRRKKEKKPTKKQIEKIRMDISEALKEFGLNHHLLWGSPATTKSPEILVDK